MLYHYRSFPDGTEINHSELLPGGRARVFIEQWNDNHDDFDSMEVYLPELGVTRLAGFSEVQKENLLDFLKAHRDDIVKMAAEKDGE